MFRYILIVMITLSLSACLSVRQEDLDSWVGQPVELLDLHPFFNTVPLETRFTDSGIEIRNYKNGRSFNSCSGNTNMTNFNENSGTGNFNGNTGAVVDLTNSNGDWIDNQNRLGKNFYIKAASTRTGLAVLRTKAVAQAQDWAADAGYVAEQLVKYNGRYWLALSSSYYNSPDATDELEWFDLGAI